MSIRRSVSVIVAIFILFSMGAVWFALTGPMHHEMGCPFMPGHEVACASPLEHLSHWQSSFLALVAEVLVFFALLVYAFRSRLLLALDAGPPRNIFSRTHRLYAPTLLQELFSDGILNRKEPYVYTFGFLHA